VVKQAHDNPVAFMSLVSKILPQQIERRRALPGLYQTYAGRRPLRRQDIVMLDNLTSHEAAGVAEAIAAQGAQLVYLPSYSPEH
jgi:transposase